MPFTGSQNVYPSFDGLLAVAEEVITTYGTVPADSAFSIVPTTGDFTVDIAAQSPKDTGLTMSKGTSVRKSKEFFVGKKNSRASFNTVADDVLLAYCLTSLFQHGVTVSGTSPKVYTAVPYTGQPTAQSNNPSKYKGLTLRKIFGGTDTNGAHQIAGFIMSRVRLSGDVGGVLTLSIEGTGLTGSPVTVVTMPTAQLVGAGRLLLDALTLKLAGSTVTPVSFSLEITNNLIQYYGQSAYPTDQCLGILDVKGDFALPSKGAGVTQFANQLSGTSQRMFGSWGTTKMTDNATTWGSAGTAAAGGFAIGTDVEFGECRPEDQNGISVIKFPWVAMDNANGFQMEVDSATTLTVAA